MQNYINQLHMLRSCEYKCVQQVEMDQASDHVLQTEVCAAI